MYTKVSEAPTFSDLQQRAKSERKSLWAVIQDEQDISYLAQGVDKGSRIVQYLVQNPAIMTYQCSEREEVIKRRKPIPLDNLEAIAKPGRSRNARTNISKVA